MPATTLRAALLLLFLSPAGTSLAQPDLRLHGSNTIGEALAPALVEAWLAARGCEAIARRETAFEESLIEARCDGQPFGVELHAHGSSTGLADLIEGRADIGMSSRPVSASEVERAHGSLGALDDPRSETVLALDGLAVIVHPGNPLRSLSKAQVRQIFAGQIRDWSQLGGNVGAISLHARDERSGTWETFRTLVLQSAALAATAARYESTNELAAKVAADPRAIGFVGMAGIGRAHALAISDGASAVAPERFEVAVEDYPLSRRLFLYAAQTPSELAREFLAFAVGEDAQRVVEDAGFVSQRIDALDARPRSGVPGDYLELVQGAQRLSLNFRFAAGIAWLDSKASRDFDRLASFLTRPENHGRELILLGFSDDSEAIPYHALAFSNDRADFVAEQLAARGASARRVRGMGAAAPVASNDSDVGRHRNRRVEVWLR